MSEPFIGEIRPFAFGFNPRNWAPCTGQLMAIAQNQALFSIVGITYGGDGRTTFALPNLKDRTPVHVGGGTNIALGEVGGVAAQTLNVTEIPSHTHLVNCKAATGTVPDSTGGYFAGSIVVSDKPKDARYAPTADASFMAAGAVATTGSNIPHQNLQPYTTLNYCIAIQGIYPSRS